MGIRADIEKAFFWVRPVLAVYGFWRQIATAVVVAVLFVWTLVDHLPWSVIAAVVFMATVSTIYLLLLPAFFRLAIRPQPAQAANFAIYKLVKVFSVSQAACLLAGISPQYPYREPEARDWHNALIDALNQGSISHIQTDNDDWHHSTGDLYHPHWNTKLSRTEFAKFCTMHNRHLEFLF